MLSTLLQCYIHILHTYLKCYPPLSSKLKIMPKVHRIEPKAHYIDLNGITDLVLCSMMLGFHNIKNGRTYAGLCLIR